MGETLILLANLATIIGAMTTCYVSIRKSREDMAIRLEVMAEKLIDLTSEVRRHNGFAEKIPVLEEKINNLEKR